MKRGFGSDNHSGVHPRILDAVSRANAFHAPSYGTDELTRKAEEVMKLHFGPDAETFFVFNGTAANVLSLSALLKPFQAVIAASQAHIINDECGAPERILGSKIIAVQTPDAKLTPELIKPHLIRRGDQHYSQVRAISLTQPTELGTVYSVEEIRALGEFARKENLFLHVDGARLVNAAVSLGVTLKEMTTDCGVDIISVGGTKNGLLFGEAVVCLRPEISKDLKYVRKQLMQLPSKTRFISAQFLEFLGTDLWKENARHANAMARRLSDGLQKSKFARVTQKVEANGVFVLIPKALVSRLRETSFFYVWDEATFECRLMTTWDTDPKDIDEFIARLEHLGESSR